MTIDIKNYRMYFNGATHPREDHVVCFGDAHVVSFGHREGEDDVLASLIEAYWRFRWDLGHDREHHAFALKGIYRRRTEWDHCHVFWDPYTVTALALGTFNRNWGFGNDPGPHHHSLLTGEELSGKLLAHPHPDADFFHGEEDIDRFRESVKAALMQESMARDVAKARMVTGT